MLLLITGCTTPSAPESKPRVVDVVDVVPTVVPQSLTIVMCCDSITFEPQWFNYSHTLKGLLADVAVRAEFVNVAIAGTGCDFWVSRLPALLIEHDADVLLLNCGTNDDATTTAAMQRFRDNYTKLIMDARAARPSEPIKVIASEVQISDHFNPRVPAWLVPNELRVNEIIYEIIRDWSGLPVGKADMSALATDSTNTPDGVHPGPEGHMFYANAWFNEGQRLGWW